MKKTKAYSLEEDIIKTIEDYQKKYNLSSASSALERIILVELPKRTELEEIKLMIKDLKSTGITVNEEVSIDEEGQKGVGFKNSSLAESFQETIDEMPE